MTFNSRGSTRGAASRRTRAGMTLIEFVLAFGLLTVVLLYTMLSLMSLVRLNRLTATEVTATNAARSQIEEAMMVARDNVGRRGISNQARALIHYYGANFGDEKIALGAKGEMIDRVELAGDGKTLTYYFGVPVPGEAARIANDGDLEEWRISARGVGRMVIYLDEESVPSAEAVDASWAFMWKDLGRSDESVVEGFDMNRDGHIDDLTLDGDPRPLITQALLNDPSGFDEEVDIVQVPIDITITYYRDDTHTGEDFQLTRRIVVM